MDTHKNFNPPSGPPGLPIGPDAPWLAPLAGYTDLPFRVLCREYGAAVACTEMVSAKGLVYGLKSRKDSNATKDLLLTTPLDGFPAGERADGPLVVQLFGDEPEFLGRAVAVLREWGFEWFDLNLGCSVPKVLRSGSGSALARDADKAVLAGRAMLREAGPGRVGFKIRLGWNRENENYLDLAKGLEDVGAGWISLHPRYAAQMFSGRADWSAAARLVRAVSIPVIAGGDLFSAENAVSCLEESGAAGVMFARGALQNPAVFAEYRALLAAGESAPAGGCAAGTQTDAAFLKKMILRHVELTRAMPPVAKRPKRGQARPDGALLKLRGSVPRYVKELPGSRAFRTALSSCSEWDVFFALLDEFFGGLEDYAGNQS